jgi:hypothetical protein
MHSTDNLNDGYIGSGKRLWRSIKKYGKENFKVEILEHLPNRELLKNREKEIVNPEFIKDTKCMNIKEGGEGGGGFCNEEHKWNFIYAGSKAGINSIKEKHKDPEYKKKWGEKRKETWINLDEKTKQKIISSGSFKGKKHSLETIEKMKKSKNVGNKNSQYGSCWITNGINNKKIKNNIPEIPNGWKLGRTI